LLFYYSLFFFHFFGLGEEFLSWFLCPFPPFFNLLLSQFFLVGEGKGVCFNVLFLNDNILLCILQMAGCDPQVLEGSYPMPSAEARKQMALQYDNFVSGGDGAAAAAAMTKMAANLMNTAADIMSSDSGTTSTQLKTTADVAETGVSGVQATSQLLPSGVSQVRKPQFSHCLVEFDVRQATAEG
jgi:hypothetical protein